MTLENTKGESAQARVGDDTALELPTFTGPTSGVVYLEEPTAAEVVIQDMDGQELHRTQATATGTFYLPELDLPERYKVIATLADGTGLERVSEGKTYLWIDLISHLTSRYIAAHPDASLADADHAVRAGLGLDPEVGTNGLSSLAGSPFSARLFLAAAKKNGGFEAFCRAMTDRFAAGKVSRFRVRLPLTTALDDSVAAEEETTGGVTRLFKFIGTTVGGDIISKGTSDLLGMGLAAVGLNVGTSKALANIQSTLDEVQSELVDLTNLIENLNLTDQVLTDYNAIKSINIGFKGPSDSLAQETLTASKNLTGNAANTFDHGPADIPSATITAMQNLLNVNVNEEVQTLLDYLNSSIIADNFILTFNQFFASQVYPQPKYSYPQNFYYSLRQDHWTVGDQYSLQAALDYVRSSVITGVNLWSESAQLSVLPEGTLSGMNTPATALNLVRYGGGNDGAVKALLDLVTAQNLVPAPTGYAQVLIDLVHNRMWYLQYMGGDKGPQWASAQNTLTGNPPFQLGPWTAAPYPSNYQNAYFDGETGPDGGWRFPTRQECSDLRSLTDGNNQYSLEALGFNVPSGYNHRIHLYGKPYPGGFGTTTYHAFDWDNGQLVDEEAYGGGPQWNYMYVRNIPDFTSGDSSNLCIKSYGFAPNLIQLFQNGKRYDHGETIQGVQNGALGVWAQVPHSSVMSNISFCSEWSSSDPSIMNFAVINGTSVVTQWHKPGTVKVTVTFRGAKPSDHGTAGEVQTITATNTMTSPLSDSDTFSSVEVSPYNTGYLTPPDQNDQQSFYLLGFYTGGGVEDLTNQATWTALDANTQQPLDPNIAAFSNQNSKGSLVFGSDAGKNHNILIQASYDSKTYEANLSY